MQIDRLEEAVELGPMVWIALEVAPDHITCALKDHLEDPGHLLRDGLAQPRRQSGQQVEHLGVSSLRQVAAVVGQHRFQQRRDKLLRELLDGHARLSGARFRRSHVNERLDQPERVPLDIPHELHVRVVHHLRPVLGRAIGDVLAAQLVDPQHIHVDSGQLLFARGPDGADHPFVHPKDQRDLPEQVVVLQALERRVRADRGEDLHPLLVEDLHDLRDQSRPVAGRRGSDHVGDRLEVGTDVKVLQLGNVLRDPPDNLLDEGHLLALLIRHELPLALLADLEEGVDGHLLHTRKVFVHELEQLEQHGLEELPVRSQEARVLANDVHDVARDYGLVLFSSLQLAQRQQVLNHRDQESLLVDLLHGAAYGPDRPAQAVEHCRRPPLVGGVRETLP
mmetsp:Transcript_13038/g.37524  ORF Transcript_13038/g.37524 Transcript_13038/m.37524 type:complete len:393 (+) Transcript_13038:661-1839(+)